MPRTARIVLPGLPHHITQRGITSQRVFLSDDDYHKYSMLLLQQAERFALSIEGYCLMPNHVHIIATPHRTDSLAKAIGRANLIYAQYFNELHGRNGHLWQNRFYSCPMDDTHFSAAMLYVELNPVRAGIIQIPWEFPWSTAAAHCGTSPFDRRLALARWRKSFDSDEWKRLLSCHFDDELLKKITKATMTGRPLGSETFFKQIERQLGRPLLRRYRGRPRKAQAKPACPPANPHSFECPDMKQILDFVRPRYAVKDPAHDFSHIQRIIRLIGPLSEGVLPPVKPRLLCFLACFHGLAGDLREDEFFRTRTRTLLDQLGWTAQEITEALESVQRHINAPQTGEEMVVHDANCAETLGALGIAKAFTTGGARAQGYETTLDVFEKSILPKTKFLTPVGRKLAADADSFTRDFLARLRREL